jgi:hypothetical protein
MTGLRRRLWTLLTIVSVLLSVGAAVAAEAAIHASAGTSRLGYTYDAVPQPSQRTHASSNAALPARVAVPTAASVSAEPTEEAATGFAAEAGTALPEALTLGRNAEEGVHVYYGTSGGKNIYAGITNNVERRGIEHGDRFVLNPITTEGLTRGEARAVEQALIVRNPGFENIRNSISPNHAWYQDAVDWGEAWLQRNGY